MTVDYETDEVLNTNHAFKHLTGRNADIEKVYIHDFLQDGYKVCDLVEMWNARSDQSASISLIGGRMGQDTFQFHMFGMYKSDDGVVTIGMRDVDKEARYMEELARGERRFRGLVDAVPSGILALDEKGRILFASATAREILGYNEYNLDHLHWSDLLKNNEHPSTSLSLVDEHEDGVVTYYTKFQLADGVSIDVMSRVTKISDADIQGEYLAVFTDISAETSTQSKLAVTASILKGLLSASPSEIMILSSDFEVYMYNDYARDRYHKQYGIEIEKDLKLSSAHYSTLPCDYQEKFLKSETQGAYELEYDSVDSDGHVLRYQAVYLTIRSEFTVIGYLEIIRDITELLARERELESSRASYRSIFQNSSDGIIVLDSDRKTITDANDRARELLKLSEDSVLLGTNLHDHIEIDIDDTKSSVSKEDLLYPEAYGQLHHYHTPSGESYWYEIKLIEATFSEQAHYICFIVDVDRRYRLLTENIEKNQLLENFISISRLGIDIIAIEEVTENGPIGKVEYRNDHMHRYLQGRGASTRFDVEDRLIHIADDPADLSIEMRDMVLRLSEDGFSESELRKTIDGEDLTFKYRCQLMTVRDKLIFIRVLEDISERVYQESEIKRQMSLLDQTNMTLEKYIESNLQLENFAYIASHDLRAPLRAIMSFSNLLNQKYRNDLDHKGQKYLDIILRSSDNMLAFIDDLLLFSRVNTQDLQIERFPSDALQKPLQEEFSHLINEKHGALNFHEWSGELMGDKTKLKIVLQNLISNSIKFCKADVPPQIDCTLYRSGSAYMITVADNGIGFEEKYSEKIFQIFEKLHSHDKYEGTGLGLAISSKIIKKHKGTMTVSSALGSGTTFVITIDEQLLTTSPI